jgi:hypothetical protein
MVSLHLSWSLMCVWNHQMEKKQAVKDGHILELVHVSWSCVEIQNQSRYFYNTPWIWKHAWLCRTCKTPFISSLSHFLLTLALIFNKVIIWTDSHWRLKCEAAGFSVNHDDWSAYEEQKHHYEKLHNIIHDQRGQRSPQRSQLITYISLNSVISESI